MKKILLTLSLLGLSTSAFAAHHDKGMEYKTLSFNKGVTTLTEAQRSEINDMARKFNKKGADVDVTIATWSDEPIPAKGKSLSPEQVDIADKRTQSIKDYIKVLKLDVDETDSFNMAKNPNLLAQAFNTEDNKIKKAVKSETADSDVMKNKYKIIKDNGDTGKAVILVRYDD